MRSVLLISTVVAVAVGCNQGSPPPAIAPEAAVSSSTTTACLDSSPPDVLLDHATSAFCRSQWTCDSLTYYALHAACEAACGVGACFLEPHCTAGCVCP